MLKIIKIIAAVCLAIAVTLPNASSAFASGTPTPSPAPTMSPELEIIATKDAVITDLQDELIKLRAQLDAPQPDTRVYEPKITLLYPSVIANYGAPYARESFFIRNIGAGNADNVLIQADPGAKAPFTIRFLDGSNTMRHLANGIGAEIKMEIRFDNNAPTGTYPVEITYQYFNSKQESIKDTDTLYIKIENFYNTIVPLMQGTSAMEALLKSVEKQLDEQKESIKRLHERIDDLFKETLSK